MAEDRLTIDTATVFDNVDERRVEFAASVDGERRAFAASYDLLRALSGEDVGDRPVAVAQRLTGQLETAAATALARDPDQTMIVVSENDLA
ncbi:hypothetical protein [Sphingomonas sp. 1P08PE]|uniref:hypothetical protein n=1 Tax=Sphingomonas sp. 1P08PE TaxID=554122 RepID=UPI0039A2A2DA